MVTDKETVRGMVDRRIENIIFPLKNKIVDQYPMLSPLSRSFWPQIVTWINTKVDMLMDLSFPTGAETAEQGLANMNEIVGALIGSKLQEMGLSDDFMNMDITKLLK